MSASDHIVDVQFSGELLMDLFKTVKACTQRAHFVFGPHDLAVIGDAQHDYQTGPASLISFRLTNHTADHYHVNIIPVNGDEGKSKAEGSKDEDDLLQLERTSLAVSVDLSDVLNIVSGKNFKSASIRMMITHDQPTLLDFTLTGRCKKHSRISVDTTMSPISVRHDYPAYSARSIVGQELYNTFNDIANTNERCEIRYQGDEIIFEGKQKINKYDSVEMSTCTLPVANPPHEAATFKAQGEFNAKELKTFTKRHKLGHRINMYLNNGLPLMLEILLPNYDKMAHDKLPTSKKKGAAKRTTSADELVDKMKALDVADPAVCKDCQSQLGVPLAETPLYVGYVRFSLRGDVSQKHDDHQAADENDNDDDDDELDF